MFCRAWLTALSAVIKAPTTASPYSGTIAANTSMTRRVRSVMSNFIASSPLKPTPRKAAKKSGLNRPASQAQRQTAASDSFTSSQ